MIQPPPPTLITYAGETALAFLAGAVVATTQLSTSLCGGDEELPPRKRRQAWATFFIALGAAPLFGGTMTQPLVAYTHGVAPWPAATVVIGISANTLWPMIGSIVRTMTWAKAKAWIREALRDKGDPA